VANDRSFSIRFDSRAAELLGLVNHEINRKVVAMGTEFRRVTVDEVLVGERTGNWRRVPGTNRMYRASRPGEPPATRTGDLRRSIAVSSVQGQGMSTTVKVGSALHYARELEENLNRKFFEPALALATPALQEILRGEWGI